MTSSSKLSYILFLSFISRASACCLPQKWEGKASIQLINFGMNSLHLTEGSTSIAVDQIEKKQAITYYNMTADGKSQPGTIFTLIDFKKKTQYTVRDNACQQTTLATDMQSNCFQGDWKIISTTNIGAEKEFIPVQTYRFKLFNATMTFSVTKTQCYPVIQAASMKLQGGGLQSQNLIYGITLGIKNPDIFAVPSVCKHTKTKKQKDGSGFIPFM